MAQAKTGDIVKVHYTGSTEDGVVFDSSKEREPLQVTLGQQMVVPGFEKAIIGMELGSTINTTFPPEEGYGSANEEMIIPIPKNEFPESIEPQIGLRLEADSGDGQTASFVITEILENEIIIDGNHFLADKTLSFEITLLEIL